MRFPLVAALRSVLLFTSIARADPILYGGNGGHPNIDGTPLSIHNGWLVGIDQDTGTVVPIGHPDDVARISGIAFASYDLLYATTLGGGGFPDTPPPPNSSRLVLINPNTGALVSDFGLIRAGVGGQGISIADLAIQPGCCLTNYLAHFVLIIWHTRLGLRPLFRLGRSPDSLAPFRRHPPIGSRGC
jgi:hypothetical protein